MTVARGVLVGFVGGLIAAGVMSAVHHALSNVMPRPPAGAQQEEDATVKVASGVTRALLQRDIPEDSKPRAGSIVHYGFGATVGAVYGGIAEAVPRVTVGAGLPFGVAVWLGAHVIMVPAAGLAPPPWRRPFAAELLEFVAHLLYGATTELVRRSLRRRV
jgi:putative membrane protein